MQSTTRSATSSAPGVELGTTYVDRVAGKLIVETGSTVQDQAQHGTHVGLASTPGGANSQQLQKSATGLA